MICIVAENVYRGVVFSTARITGMATNPLFQERISIERLAMDLDEHIGQDDLHIN